MVGGGGGGCLIILEEGNFLGPTYTTLDKFENMLFSSDLVYCSH